MKAVHCTTTNNNCLNLFSKQILKMAKLQHILILFLFTLAAFQNGNEN